MLRLHGRRCRHDASTPLRHAMPLPCFMPLRLLLLLIDYALRLHAVDLVTIRC